MAEIELEKPAGGEEIEGEEKRDKVPEGYVPTGALIEERRHFRAREEQLRAELEAAKKSAAKPEATKRDLNEVEQRRKDYREFLGQDKAEERLEALEKKVDEKLAKLEALEAQFGETSQAAKVAQSQYENQVAGYAASHYDPKTMPVDQATWEEIVAAKMTPEEAMKIKRGEPWVIDAAIERAKKSLKGGGKAPLTQKVKDAEHVRTLPKTPAPGGTPPSPEDGEKKEPFTARGLHDKAFERLKSLREAREG